MKLLHANFPSTLCSRIVATLLATQNFDSNTDPTYNMCIARWALWGIDQWDDSESEIDLRTELISNMLCGLVRDLNGPRKHSEAYVPKMQPSKAWL